MKNCKTILNSAFFICLLSLLCTSCKNTLDLVEAGKETPIVYGFLSLNDTATYIRVERSFIDAQTSAKILAGVPDSLYYTNITVTLVRVSNNEKFVLSRVDGNTEGYRRDTGAFAQSPNYLYKVKNATLSMKADEKWRITIQRNGDTKPLAQATTSVIGNYTIFAPQSSTPLYWTYDNTLSVSIETTEQTAKFYDVKAIIYYDELIGSVRTAKQIEWSIASGYTRKGTDIQTFFRQNAKEFYAFLGNTLPVNANATRYFKNFDIQVTAGGQELLDYSSINVANIGITGSQTIPNYTNIENGLGVFTSRNTTILKGLTLNDQSITLLKNGDLTKNLNFR